jgi:hypothetical protein
VTTAAAPPGASRLSTATIAQGSRAVAVTRLRFGASVTTRQVVVPWSNDGIGFPSASTDAAAAEETPGSLASRSQNRTWFGRCFAGAPTTVFLHGIQPRCIHPGGVLLGRGEPLAAGVRKDRHWFDLGAGLDWAGERLQERIYEI